ncbi:hypothetical protein L9F63_009489, partial [Diploptera punctata]
YLLRRYFCYYKKKVYFLLLCVIGKHYIEVQPKVQFYVFSLCDNLCLYRDMYRSCQ